MPVRSTILPLLTLVFLSGCNCGSGSGSDAGAIGGGSAGGGSVGGGSVGGGSAGGGSAGGGGGSETGGGSGGGGSGVDAGTDAGTIDAGPPCGIPVDETVNATLYMSIDDEGTLYINGEFVAVQGVPWNTGLRRTIQVKRNPTVPNVVAIEARNVYQQGGVDRAALVDFRLGDAGWNEAPEIFLSGAGWKTLIGLDAGVSDGGWAVLGFDDSTWTDSVAQLNYGSGPYGNIFSMFGLQSSNAKWMWAYDSAAAATKPTFEPIFFRHVFFFGVDGGFSRDAGVCPSPQ